MSSCPVIISDIKPSCLIPIEPQASDAHAGIDWGAGDSCAQSYQIQVLNPRKPCGGAEPDVLKTRAGSWAPMSSVPHLKIDNAAQGQQVYDEVLSCATNLILDAYAEACSRLFSAMRACIRRERARQCVFREENGLPNSAKIPYQRQPVTAEEQSVADMSESVMRRLFGDRVADYAREKFERAIDTGDMRAFKIRLLVIKARDCLRKEKSPLLPWFVKGMDQCIDKAEKDAGCIPDPSPRRMSKAEQDKKRKKEEEEKRLRDMQPELPLVWTSQDDDGSANQGVDRPDSVQSTDKCISNAPVWVGRESNSYVLKKESKDVSVSERTQDSDNVTVTVTVTNDHSEVGKQSEEIRKHSNDKSGVVRKAREYNTVEQILDDIEDGRIVPYESSDEICADIKAGLLTPVEALMFTRALDRYSPEGAGFVDDEDDEDEEDDEDGIEDDGFESGSSFSYNQNGSTFAERFDGESEDWYSDNEW